MHMYIYINNGCFNINIYYNNNNNNNIYIYIKCDSNLCMNISL